MSKNTKKQVIRFEDENILWITENLFKTRWPIHYGYPFCFKEYNDQIKKYIKNLNGFYFYGELILSEILNQNISTIIWNANTGYPDITTSGKFLSTKIGYKVPNLPPQEIRKYPNYWFGIRCKPTLKKYLTILEKLRFITIEGSKSNAFQVIADLERIIASLKLGTERAIEGELEMYEMNNIEPEDYLYERM